MENPLSAKNNLLWWDILENKVLTWDNLQKRTFEGLGRCALCRIASESGLHLFL